jgi:hypothetical protein
MLRSISQSVGHARTDRLVCRKQQKGDIKFGTWNVYVIRVIKSKIMSWAGHEARMGEGRVVER